MEKHGKKIFFIYPNSRIRNEVIYPLIDREYEVYVIENHRMLSQISILHTDYILFLNIDEILNSSQWDRIIAENDCSGIGILTFNENGNTRMKYETNPAISCGYHSLRQRPEQLLKNVLESLKKVDADEKRQFIRATFSNRLNSFSLNLNGRERLGTIHDISSAGMTLIFEKPCKIEMKTAFDQIMLKIYESNISVSAIYLGARRDERGELHCLFIFDKEMKESVRTRLRLVINRFMEEQMLKSLADDLPTTSD